MSQLLDTLHNNLIQAKAKLDGFKLLKPSAKATKEVKDSHAAAVKVMEKAVKRAKAAIKDQEKTEGLTHRPSLSADKAGQRQE
tara:strand:- start:48 stop:296 length:249 start_codon:yes stop_codon:yes gene_type:complete